MSLAPITLPTDKSTAVIDNAHRSLRQDESGLSITVTVLNADNTAYNLTGKNLVFCENKKNNKIIIDNGHGDNCGTFIRNSDNDTKGIFTYVLQENVYVASGRAWFEIADGNTVDSTKNFYFDVETDAQISVTDNDYIGSLKALETAMAGVQDKVTSDLADMENQINQYIANTNTSSAAQITQAVKNLTEQTTAALSNVNQYTQKLATLQSQWNSELQSIQAKATNDTDSAVQAINDKYTNDFAQLKSDFTNWQTSTTQNYQKQVDDILAKVQADDTEVAGVQKQVDDTIAKMQTLSQQFSKIDFTQFLKPSALDNYYTKAEIDPMIAQAGKLKTINGKAPDSNGDIQVPAYAPNLLLGTSHTPITEQITEWGGFAYHLSENISSGTKVSVRAYVNNQTSTSVYINGVFNTSEHLFDTLVSTVTVAPHSAGYTYGTCILNKDFDKNAGQLYIASANYMSDSESVTISDLKLAVWSDPNTPPDMTWVPNEADKANSIDVTTLQGTVTSQGTAISKNTDAIATKANSSDVYTKSDLDPKLADKADKSIVNIATQLFHETNDSSSWRNIFGVGNPNPVLTSLRIDPGSGSLINDDAAGIGFGGADTKGVLSVDWMSPNAKITAGNGDSPVWNENIAWKSDIATLQGRIAALENAQPIMASSQDDAVAKSKNSNNEYYW